MDKKALLQHYFGYGEFRPGQEELVDGILSGRDVFGIMPTGGGNNGHIPNCRLRRSPTSVKNRFRRADF